MSERAGGPEQGPLGLLWGRTLGPEAETGKNKAKATIPEEQTRVQAQWQSGLPLIGTGDNSPSAFWLQKRNRVHIARYMVPDSLCCPPGTKNGP